MILKGVLLLLISVKFVSANILYSDPIESWRKFKTEFGKHYHDIYSEKRHFRNYLQSWILTHKHNAKYFQSLVPYKLAINHLADFNREERLKFFYGFNLTMLKSTRGEGISATFLKPENVFIPKSINWTAEGAVTEVKDQEYCGSCWAFSATGALEGQQYRLSKKLISLSEQNLIDCSYDYGNNGCFGGLMTFSYEYVRENKGIDTEESYPYDGEDWMCRFDPKYVGATDKGYVEIPYGSEKALMEAVATVGPISVAIDAADEKFQLYKEGVYVGKSCNKYNVNHAVLIVGYGTDSKTGLDYWLVKNSWGKKWGDKGYIKMVRNKNNANCIASYASYPLM
ncbi:unnamed protein product [Hermetia illucens]|uniref:cathepsin L n=1 Tax=Hermetia illucens TaxID=343691 RepID=A0A7R8UX11_HERIL|nr:procathepsin L-like [Hermetia illucens]CAD7088603.1 unnamed protein product [Hermetia illucens]